MTCIDLLNYSLYRQSYEPTYVQNTQPICSGKFEIKTKRAVNSSMFEFMTIVPWKGSGST